MHFNVSQLLKEPGGSRRRHEVDDPISGQHLGLGRVSGSVALLRTDAGIWVSASLDSSVTCECSRCLTEHLQPVHMEVEEEYFPVMDVATGGRLQGDDDTDGTFSIDQRHTLDLTEAVKQYSVLNTPMNPVCRRECAGLCSICGTDLNNSSCMCDNSERDPRWGPLIDLARVSEEAS